MRKSGLMAVLATLATVAVPGIANAQSFDGSTVNYQYYYPNSGTPYTFANNGNYVVGAGVEIGNVADSLGTMDISANNLFVDFLTTSSWNPADFNGWVLSDQTDSLATIFDVSINPATNMAGFSLANLSWTGDSISVNWAGLAFTSDTILSLDVSFVDTAVPEPSTWAMMLLGFGAVGFALRRRRQTELTLRRAV